MKNRSEHRFDLPSATEPHIKFEQARVLRCEAAEHLGGGCDLVGLRLLLLSQSAPAETDSGRGSHCADGSPSSGVTSVSGTPSLW
jgi:hypothetical protein